MMKLIRDAFPNIEDCIISFSEKHQYVFDDPQLKKGLFVKVRSPWHLHIENSVKQELHFIQNDNCVMKNIKSEQCDYLILSNVELYFIEVKVSSTKNRLSNHKIKAYSQIENTFRFYRNNLDFPANLMLCGLICFPKNKRIVQASESTKQKEFKTKYNIDLRIGNYILFE